MGKLIETSQSYQGMQNVDLKKLVDHAWNEYESVTKDLGADPKISLKNADDLSSVILQMLKKRGLLPDGQPRAAYVDIMIAAALLHNLYYLREDWTTLFRARQVLYPVGEEIGIAKSVLDALFQTIEGQLGEDTPVPNVKPIPNTPTDFFATACWIIYGMNAPQEKPLWN